MRTPRLLATIASVPVFALALGGAPVHAESWRGHDARGDVRSYVVEFDTKCEVLPEGDRAPNDERRDITRLSVDHGAEDVVIEMAVRDVARHDEDTSYEAVVRTPDRIYQVDIFTTPPAGLQMLISTVRVGRDPECGPALTGGHVVECDGAVGDVDQRADRVLLTIPRTCLGTPRWVRVGALAGGFDADQLTQGSTSITIAADVWGPAGTTFGLLLPPSGPRVKSD